MDLANNESQQRFRTPFYFGLLAFEKEFFQLNNYVETRLDKISEQEKLIISFISIAYFYAHKSLPAQFFTTI